MTPDYYRSLSQAGIINNCLMGHGRPGQSGGGNEQKRDDEQLKFVGNFRQTRPELWSGSDGPRPGTMGSERGTVGRRVPQWASQWLIGVYCLAAAVFGSGTAAASGCLGTDWIIDEKVRWKIRQLACLPLSAVGQT